MTEQLDRWRGAFGDEYTERNQIDPATRSAAWRVMLEGLTTVNSILEVGANRGLNFRAMRLLPRFPIDVIRLVGIDPNRHACDESKGLVRYATLDDLRESSTYDLVFTCGVLIHVPPKELDKTLRQIYRLSRRYILAIEYYERRETMIPYRGIDNMLWKRDYEHEYEKLGWPEWGKERMLLRTIRSGFWSKADGFDDCHWWLMEKI